MLYDKRWDAKIESDAVKALRSAKDLISDPSKWICGDYARDKNGAVVRFSHSGAVAFCSIGALAVALNCDMVGHAEYSAAGKYLKAAAKDRGFSEAHVMNDKGHDYAMAMFDRAIELALSPQDNPHE